MDPILTLTTDFGPGEYVGAMKGVILRIDSTIAIVDIDHQIRPHDVLHGAYVLYSAVPYFPSAAHVAVVDPGVGTARRGVVAVCEGGLLVGPDNGLLMPAARRLGVKEVREIRNRDLCLPDVSSTFHGRDMFAPVAAHLLAGRKAREVGPVIRDPVDLDFGRPRRRAGALEGRILTHDRFGNLVTNLPRKDVERSWSAGDRLAVTLGGYDLTVPLVRTYGDVPAGEYLATISSSGFLEIARRERNAAAELGVSGGVPVVVRKA